MDIKTTLLFLLSAIILGIVIFLPLWWLARRFARKRPKSSYAQTVTIPSLGYHAIFVALLFAGFGSQYYAPSSVVGALVSTHIGLLIFTLSVIGLETIVAWIRRALSARSFETKIANLIAPFPIVPWTESQTTNEEIPADQAYSIKLFNDNSTNSNFVVSLLHHCFAMDLRSAFVTMMKIHNGGEAKLGRMSSDDAARLSNHIAQQSSKYNFSFRCEVVPFL